MNFFLVWQALPLTAQTTNCDPCPEVSFDPVQTYVAVITVVPPCSLTIRYQKRYCEAEATYDVKILDVTTSGGCAMLPHEALNKAAYLLILKNAMGFPPNSSNPALATWRLIRPACVMYTEYFDNGSIKAAPCGTECCLREVQVSYLAGNYNACNLVYSWQTAQSGVLEPCPFIEGAGGNLCRDACSIELQDAFDPSKY